MNHPARNSYETDLESFLVGDHGERMAKAAAAVANRENPATVLGRANPDYHRSLYDGMEVAQLYELLRKAPLKPKQQLAREIKAPFRAWSLTAATGMLRQLRRAKHPDLIFGLQLIQYVLEDSAPVTSACWPDTINEASLWRAADQGIATTTVAEAVDLYGIAAVRIALVLAPPGTMREAFSIAQVFVEDQLCPPAWRDIDTLAETAAAFVELAGAFQAHRRDDEGHEHDGDDAPFDEGAFADADTDAVDADVADGGGEDTDRPPTFTVEPQTAQTPGTTPVAPTPIPAPDGAIGDRPAQAAPGGPSEIITALREMVRLDQLIRSTVGADDLADGPATVASQMTELRAPGNEAAELDKLTAAIVGRDATDDEVGFATAVVALANASADGGTSTMLRELDSAARQFDTANRFPQLLFDASRNATALTTAPEPDPVVELLRAAIAERRPLPYHDPLITQAIAGTSTPPDGTADAEAADTGTGTLKAATDAATAGRAPAAEDTPPADVGGHAQPDASDTHTRDAADASTGTDDGASASDADDGADGVVTGAEPAPGAADASAPASDPEPTDDTGATPDAPAEITVSITEQLDAAAGQTRTMATADSDFRARLAAAIGDNRLSLAVHLCAREGDDARRVVLETACLAGALRSPSSLIAGAIGTRIGALYVMPTDQALRPLLAASAARATLIAPATGASSYCQMLVGQDHPGIGAAAASILTTLADAATHGIVFSAASAVSAGEDAGRAAEIETLQIQARAEMQRHGRNMFARASYMMDQWRQKGAPLFNLLDPVINDRRADAANVALLASSLRGHGAIRLVEETDDAMRTTKQARVTGTARNSLIKRINSATTIAAQWATLVGATATPPRGGGAGIRSRLAAQRPGLTAELAERINDNDCLVVAAATMAGRLYDDIFTITAGQSLAGIELVPEVALNADLLRFGVPFVDAHNPDPAADIDALVEVPFPTLDEALATYARSHDLSNAAALVAVCEASSGSCDLRADLEATTAASRDKVAARKAEVEAELTSHRRRGQLLPALSDTADARIETAGRPDRLDVGVALHELDALVADFKTSAAQIAAALNTSLDQLVDAGTDIDPVGLERVRAQITEGELGTADDLLSRLKLGEPLGELERTNVDVATFWPAVPAALTNGIDAAVRAAAAAGTIAHSVVDYSGLGAGSAPVTKAFDGWVQARDGARVANWIPLLREALKLCGIEIASEKTAVISGGSDRVWVDFYGVRRTGKAMVPEFGDTSGDRMRCLLVWGHPPAEKLVSWSDADSENRALAVLHFGTMDTKTRIALHDRLRTTNRRPMIVVDDAVLAWVAAQGTGTLETMMRAVLPFSSINPYTNATVVPVEMFYGRYQERRNVMYDPETTFIHGGRRLGKSALLRAAQREFSSATQKAIYIDLYDSSIGATRRPEVVWDLLERELGTAGIIEIPKTRRRRAVASEDVVVDGIRAWLDVDRQRHLLVLLDETDAFFDQDALKGFSSTGRFRSLKENHGGRFKVVFAGLHQVQRFAGHPNQPFPQLGRPAPIGPLATRAAFELLVRPLGALGYSFDDADLVSRLVGRCNAIPILLQACGRQLLIQLRKRPDSGGCIPRPITAADVDEVLNDQGLNDEIIGRFDMTLELDQRYKVIVYTIALHGQPMTTENLYADCAAMWPAGFKNNNLASFRALVQELVDLGVLTAAGGASDKAWEIRGINVRALLGSDDRILARLFEIAETSEPPHEFAAARDRMKLPNGKRSPLSASQITDAMSLGFNQWCVVIGTKASGVAQTGAAIHEGVNRFASRVKFTSVSAAPMLASALRVPASEAVGHHVVVDDLASKSVTGANVERTVRTLVAAGPPTGYTRSVVFVITPSQYVELLEVCGPGDRPTVITCERFDAQSFDVLQYSLEKGFRDAGEREQLLETTGGWPVLVERACEFALSSATSAVLAKIRWEMDSVVGDDQLLDDAGLDSSVLRRAFHTLAQVAPTAADAADVDTLVGFVADSCSIERPDLVVAALRAGDLLAVCEGESLCCEPVLAGAAIRVGLVPADVDA